MKRRNLASWLAVLTIAVAGCASQQAQTSDGSPAPTPVDDGATPTAVAPDPSASPVEIGSTVPFQVGHCGLKHVVEFDGSYWDVDEASMTSEENSRFGINSDEGTMTLSAKDEAVYRSHGGGEAVLYRHAGDKSFFACL